MLAGTLRDKLQEVGNAAVALPDLVTLEAHLQDDEKTIVHFSALSDLLTNLDRFCDDNQLTRINPIPPETVNSTDYAPNLAFRMLSHELGKFTIFIRSYLKRIRAAREECHDDTTSLDKLKGFVVRYELARITASAMAYAGTGEPRFNLEVSAQSLEKVLSGRFEFARKGKGEFRTGCSGISTFSAAESYLALQLVGNAANLGPLAWSVGFEAFDTSVDGVSYRAMVISDTGEGIPSDKLLRLFDKTRASEAEMFTMPGFGVVGPPVVHFGLLFVGRLIELRNGFAQITSAMAGQPAYAFDTRTGTVREAASKQETGTTFKLYFPKQPAATLK